MSKFVKLLIILLVVCGSAVSTVFLLKRPEASLGSVRDELVVGGLLADFQADGSATSSPYTVTLPFGVSGWRTASFVFENMANATVDIYGTNDTLASSSVAQWTDISTDLIGAANFNSNRAVFIDTPIILSKIRFVVTTSTSVLSTVRIKGVFSSK